MKSEKRVLFAFVFVLVIAISIIGVSASWWNTITGNAAAKAYVNVTNPTVSPQVIYVSKMNTSDGNVVITIGGKSYYSYNFTAFSIGGYNVLPQFSDGNFQAELNGGINGTSNNGVYNLTSEVYCRNMSIGFTCSNGTVSGPNCMNYSCDVPVWYFYDPIPWTINASVCDHGGRCASNNSQTFSIGSMPGYDFSPNPISINWTNIQLAGPNKTSDNNVTVNNTGNVLINLRVNATMLYGAGGPSDTANNISGSNFISGGLLSGADCGVGSGMGINLNNNNFVNIPAGSYSLSWSGSTTTTAAKKDLMFCIKTVSNIMAQTYSTDNGGSQWTISNY